MHTCLIWFKAGIWTSVFLIRGKCSNNWRFNQSLVMKNCNSKSCHSVQMQNENKLWNWSQKKAFLFSSTPFSSIPDTDLVLAVIAWYLLWWNQSEIYLLYCNMLLIARKFNTIDTLMGNIFNFLENEIKLLLCDFFFSPYSSRAWLSLIIFQFLFAERNSKVWMVIDIDPILIKSH